MFSKAKDAEAQAHTQSIMNALNTAQAMICFDVSGNITKANKNFLDTVGYSEEEIIGKHHRLFVSEAYAASEEYKSFWQRLGNGEAFGGEFERVNKKGEAVWLQASYNPVFDKNDNMTGVVKFAIDITGHKVKTADYESQLNAISRSQAVIEFDLDATILKANDNFCGAMGYRPDEIVGKKHAMFVEPGYAASKDYQDFWNELRSGSFKSEEFKRIGKNGKIVWIQASYNPIFDGSGTITKVVKYATDITARKQIMAQLGTQLTALSHGDLSVRMTGTENTEFQDLGTAFNETMGRLTHLITDIQTATSTMSSGTSKIAQGARDLSDRTEQQAASLEETNAALEDISSNITATATSAQTANTSAEEAEQRAVQGDSVVRSAISAMDRIEEGSKKITEIISVIESISFQTNLLALNAAVEAARAGESGKGFAVVASEVRTLAQRSSEAANDITQLIESSSSQVTEGAGLVRSTGEVLSEIQTSINSVVGSVKQISEASQNQAKAINGISAVVSGIDANTQSNAQLAQQSASGAISLTQEAERLAKLSRTFALSKPSTSSAATYGSGEVPLAKSA